MNSTLVVKKLNTLLCCFKEGLTALKTATGFRVIYLCLKY